MIILDTNKIKELDKEYSNLIRNNCMTDDPKIDHQEADAIIISLLNIFGFVETIKAYNAVGKYYV